MNMKEVRKNKKMIFVIFSRKSIFQSLKLFFIPYMLLA